MESIESHNAILLALGEIKQSVEGVKARMDIANGNTAKHADKLASQDILNAQVTISQQQLLKDIKGLQDLEKANNEFRLTSKGSINTFKWLFGFVGIGTLITLLKVLTL